MPSYSINGGIVGALPSSPATGDIVYYNGSAWVSLARGSNGQALVLAAGLPSWASAGALPTATAAGAVPLSDGAGTSYTATDLTAATVSARTTTLLGSSTGWTLTPVSGGSATISGGSLVLVCPTGKTSASSLAVYAGSIPSTGRWRLQWRQTFASVDTQAGVYMRLWLDWDGSLGTWDRVQQLPNGDFDGSNQAGGVLVSSVNLPVDGTMWTRIECDGKSTKVWTGVGSGDTEPTAWTFRGSADNPSHVGFSRPNSFFFNVGIEGGGTSTSSQTLTIRDLTLYDAD